MVFKMTYACADARISETSCELTRSCLAVKHQLSDRGSPTVLFILLLESVVRPERHDLRSTYGPEEFRGQGLVPRMTSVLLR